MTSLLKLKMLRPEMKEISDLAFACLDTDDSGSLDADELHDMVRLIAAQENLHPPKTEDVEGILGFMDDDSSGLID